MSLPAIETKQQPYATLTQFCGPATVNVRVHGRSIAIHGGYCDASGVFWQYKLYVGLAGYVPAAPARFFGLAVHDRRAFHGGTFTRAYVSIQLAGHGLRSVTKLSPPFPASVPVPEEITQGTVTVAKSLRAGTFAFGLREATRITGSWTCGEKPYTH